MVDMFRVQFHARVHAMISEKGIIMPRKSSVSTEHQLPATQTEATLLVRRLLGSYPSQNLHDPEMFMAELMTVFLRYPVWIDEQASNLAKKESPVFIPSIPAVETAAEKILSSSRSAAPHAHQSKHHIREQRA